MSFENERKKFFDEIYVHVKDRDISLIKAMLMIPTKDEEFIYYN